MYDLEISSDQNQKDILIDVGLIFVGLGRALPAFQLCRGEYIGFGKRMRSIRVHTHNVFFFLFAFYEVWILPTKNKEEGGGQGS